MSNIMLRFISSEKHPDAVLNFLALWGDENNCTKERHAEEDLRRCIYQIKSKSSNNRYYDPKRKLYSLKQEFERAGSYCLARHNVHDGHHSHHDGIFTRNVYSDPVLDAVV
ncbi:hypothetical protein HYQ45_008859 [Verticillium longisporum]|uniref:Uncharacterized protein n=1 Tax=Verticillium longisporum TaxID=100787 RepID=A0A8I2ZLU2_VERLO|nr:hypothetical protein HYQ45_008859 [Verticillium longisporum]